MTDVTLAQAKAHLSMLIAKVVHGDAVRITRRGKPVAQLTPLTTERSPVDLDALRALTESMPLQAETAADFTSRMRDEDRY